MCTTNQQTAPNPTQSPAAEPATIDIDVRKAELRLKIAELQSAAEYNRSPAGLMQRQFETYQRLAKPLSESNFVPAAYKGNIGDCIIAVEMAARLGTFPLTVMQNLCVVKGNPTWKSRFLIGCVNSCGRYSTLDYRITLDGRVGDVKYKTWQKDRDGKNHEILRQFDRPDLDNLVCVAYATELKTGNVLTSAPVSVRMAVQEGWYSKDGSKWPTMTEQMLRYRAASFWVSAFAPEMAMGLRTEEEQRDIEDVNYEEVETSTVSLMAPKAKKSTANIESAKERLRNRASSDAATATAESPAKASESPAQSTFDMP